MHGVLAEERLSVTGGSEVILRHVSLHGVLTEERLSVTGGCEVVLRILSLWMMWDFAAFQVMTEQQYLG